MKKIYNMNKLSLIAVVFMMVFVAFSSIDFTNSAKAASGDGGDTCPPEGCPPSSGGGISCPCGQSCANSPIYPYPPKQSPSSSR